MYDHERLQLFGAAEGIGLGLVNHVVEDRAGNIWAATDGGFSQIRRPHFRALTPRRSLPRQAVYDAAEDDEGAWWLLMENRLLRFPPGEIDRALADSTRAIAYRQFDALDGLPGTLGGNAFQGSQITRAADGRIWVATDTAGASIDPRKLPVGAGPFGADRSRSQRRP